MLAKVRVQCPPGVNWWQGTIRVGPDYDVCRSVSAFLHANGLLLWAPLRISHRLTETPEDIPVGTCFRGRAFSQEEVVVEVLRR